SPEKGKCTSSTNSSSRQHKEENAVRKKRGRHPKLTTEQIIQMRNEYCINPQATAEYLADKYEISYNYAGLILSNKYHPDPNYEKPQKKGGYSKRLVFLPDSIKEIKDQLTPAPTTSHRARGQNNVIN